MGLKKYTIQFRLADEVAYRKVGFEASNMDEAIKFGYAHAKGMHGVDIAEFRIRLSDIQ